MAVGRILIVGRGGMGGSMFKMTVKHDEYGIVLGKYTKKYGI